MKLTEKQLCEALTEFNGAEVDNIKQIVKITFSGEEMLEFINERVLPKLFNAKDEEKPFEFKGGVKYSATNINIDEEWVIIGVNKTHCCAAGWPPTICELKYMKDWEEIDVLTEKEIEYREKTFGGGWF
jgi:hypothetical protein